MYWRPNSNVSRMPVASPSSFQVSTFFFQAEDGIRDFHVTGVQTCALTIFIGARWNGEGEESGLAFLTRRQSHELHQSSFCPGGSVRHRLRAGVVQPDGGASAGEAHCLQIGRASCRERGKMPQDTLGGKAKR